MIGYLLQSSTEGHQFLPDVHICSSLITGNIGKEDGASPTDMQTTAARLQDADVVGESDKMAGRSVITDHLILRSMEGTRVRWTQLANVLSLRACPSIKPSAEPLL